MGAIQGLISTSAPLSNSTLERAGNRISFRGRHVREQQFCTLSFPGVEEGVWMEITALEELLPKQQRLSVGCVFFPDGDDLFGVHSCPCECTSLYKGKDPKYETWEDGKAPFGCAWFAHWKSNAVCAIGAQQTVVIVYKRGLKGTQEGLGFSQRGEAEWLRHQPDAAIVEVDIDEYLEKIIPRARNCENILDLCQDCSEDAKISVETSERNARPSSVLIGANSISLFDWKNQMEDEIEVHESFTDKAWMLCCRSHTHSGAALRLLPPGMPLHKLMIVQTVLPLYITLVGFVLPSHVNPLVGHPPSIWPCIIGCAFSGWLWMIVSFRHCLDVAVLKGTQVAITIPEMIAWWLLFSVGFGVGYALPHLWFFSPAPYAVVTGFIAGVGLLFGFVAPTLLSKISRHGLTRKHEQALRRKLINGMTYMTFLMSYIMVLNFICAFLFRSSDLLILSPIGLTFVRSIGSKIAVFLIRRFDQDFAKLGTYAIWSTTSTMQLFLMAGASDFRIALVAWVCDVLETWSAISSIRQIRSDQQTLPTPSVALDHRLYETGQELVVMELSELITATLFFTMWFIIRLSPNSSAFAGIGTHAFGLIPPDQLIDFAFTFALWFLFELVSFAGVRMYMKQFVNLYRYR